MMLIVSPALASSTFGNGVSTSRWASLLEGLGFRVWASEDYAGGDYELLVALHAHKSATSVLSFRRDHPHRPIVLVLTGTDLYPSLAANHVDPCVLDAADRIIVLQSAGLDQLDDRSREKALVIVQSAPTPDPVPPRSDVFEVSVLSHLRRVKDPLRAGAAALLLPESSSIRVLHAGRGIEDHIVADALAETATNPRYDWLGPLPREEALRLLARSRALVLSSWHEGGANVVSEAIAAGVPVLASRIPGSVGLLGEDYPGYYPAGGTAELAALMSRVEREPAFLRRLTDEIVARRPMVHPDREREAWAALLRSLLGPHRSAEERKPFSCIPLNYGILGALPRSPRGTEPTTTERV